MFLLARSAVCIALVVAALPNRPPSHGDAVAFDTITGRAGGVAEAAVDRFCRQEAARCVRALTAVATVAAQPTSPSPARL